jgi:hypothetical protein
MLLAASTICIGQQHCVVHVFMCDQAFIVTTLTVNAAHSMRNDALTDYHTKLQPTCTLFTGTVNAAFLLDRRKSSTNWGMQQAARGVARCPPGLACCLHVRAKEGYTVTSCENATSVDQQGVARCPARTQGSYLPVSFILPAGHLLGSRLSPAEQTC